jgi:8-oxo-dGTP pyrophosphatase MutT (NUDIX family)
VTLLGGLSPAALRDWITARLDPLETQTLPRAAWRSDFDLSRDRPDEDAIPLKPAAVLIGLVDQPGGLTVILTRRSDTLRSHTGQVALPGGRCDPGETPWEAALREAEEEIGLPASHVQLAGLSTPYQTGTGYHVVPVVGFVTTGFTLVPNPEEVAEVFETPFEFLMDTANHEQREGRSPAGQLRRYYAIPWRDQLIWGATAGMLRALHDRLQGAPVG